MFERKERDALPGPDDLWTRLPVPWRACVELAWEAYQAGSLPIGAVVADAEGKVISRGRNRIHERSGEDGYLFGHKLAHAELNALVTLDNDGCDPDECTLYTTTEPCPLCVGALRMSDVGGVRYAAREPWGGSAAMFETVPYLKRGNVRVTGPEDRSSGGHPRRVAHRVLPALETGGSRAFSRYVRGVYAPRRGDGKAPVPFRRARGDRRGRRAGHDLGRRQ